MLPYERVTFRLAVGDYVALHLPQSKHGGWVAGIHVPEAGVDWATVLVYSTRTGTMREYPVGMVFPA